MSGIRLRSIVDFLKKDDEILSVINFKYDEISSGCNQIKIKTQKERITFKILLQ